MKPASSDSRLFFILTKKNYLKESTIIVTNTIIKYIFKILPHHKRIKEPYFQQYFRYIMNWWREQEYPICRKSLRNFITLCFIEYPSPSPGFDLTTLVVIGTDCTGSGKSNYHTTCSLHQFMIYLKYC
jgi:hypothetical protein